MIDIHCHLLPGLDDGAQNIEQSLELARKAVEEGIHTVIATPHCIPEVYFNEGEAVLEKVRSLQEELRCVGIPLKVLPGMEVHLALDIPRRLGTGSALTLGNSGKYVLLEFPLSSVPSYSEQVIFEIMLKGIKPILAHPERNKEIIEEPTILYNLIDKGCLVQITSGSLIGGFGTKIQKLSSEFLKLGWVDFIASDAHHPQKRPLVLREAFNIAASIVNENEARKLVIENPQRVINGHPILKGEVAPFLLERRIKKKKRKTGFWDRFKDLF